MAEEEVAPGHYTLVGEALERNRLDLGFADVADTAFGIYVGHRWGWFDFALRVMTNLRFDQRFRQMYLLSALTLRAAFELFGVTFTYGVGAQVELSLRRHHWLLFATPAELGVVILDDASWHLQVYAGARVPVAGALIDSFVVDPTGIDSPEAERDLRDEKDRVLDPFVGIAFTREID